MEAASRELQVHVVDVLSQAALLPEGNTGAVGARVVAQLQVHRVDVRRQVAPKATPEQ